MAKRLAKSIKFQNAGKGREDECSNSLSEKELNVYFNKIRGGELLYLETVKEKYGFTIKAIVSQFATNILTKEKMEAIGQKEIALLLQSETHSPTGFCGFHHRACNHIRLSILDYLGKITA